MEALGIVFLALAASETGAKIECLFKLTLGIFEWHQKIKGPAGRWCKCWFGSILSNY